MEYRSTITASGPMVVEHRCRPERHSAWPALFPGLLLLLFGLSFPAGRGVWEGFLGPALLATLVPGFFLSRVLETYPRRVQDIWFHALLTLWLYPFGVAAPYFLALATVAVLGPAPFALILGLGLGGVPLVALAGARTRELTRELTRTAGESQGLMAGVAYASGSLFLVASHYLAAAVSLMLLGLTIAAPGQSPGPASPGLAGPPGVPGISHPITATAVGLGLMGSGLRRWALSQATVSGRRRAGGPGHVPDGG